MISRWCKYGYQMRFREGSFMSVGMCCRKNVYVRQSNKRKKLSVKFGLYGISNIRAMLFKYLCGFSVLYPDFWRIARSG